MLEDVGDLGVSAADAGVVVANPLSLPAIEDPAKIIADKVAPRVAEAQALQVVDQSSLDLVGERLNINKELQAQAGEIFDPVISAAHDAHKKAIAAKKKVTDPLTSEESILKLAATNYVVAESRKQEERERVARIEREAEERRLLAVAEEERKAEEDRINALIVREHEETVEAAVAEAESAGASAELIEAICNAPAPEPVRVQMEVPVIQQAPKAAPAVILPKGLSISKRYKAEVTSMALLCRAIAEGKIPAAYVEPNMTKLNARARADELGLNIPGVKAVEDHVASQRR